MNIAIVLAAGEGTRMKSKLPKVLHKVAGKSLLSYVVDASKAAGIEENIIIIGHGGQEVKEEFKGQKLSFREQPIGPDAPYGTGYAVMQGADLIKDDSNVLILCGDTPLIRGETLKKMMDFHQQGSYDGTVLTAVLDDASGYGRIKRGQDGNIVKIVEDKDASPEEKEIREINSGIFSFKGSLLKSALGKIDNKNAQGEFYLTDIVEILRDEGYKIGGYKMEDPIEIHGINSRVQLSFAEEVIRKRINEYHMEQGVTIIDPNSTYIENQVEIGSDTIIYPGAYIEEGSQIGQDCIIRGSSRIVNSKIGNQVEIETSLIEDSTVGDGTNIGPNAHLRPNSQIGKNVRLGNFVEVKNSQLGDGTKAGHLAYIGDAKLGKNVNIGCGAIFANYDGSVKEEVVVGDNCFIGSNATLIAPLKIDDQAYIAAGSTINLDIERGALAIARAHQVNKEGWVEKNKNNKK